MPDEEREQLFEADDIGGFSDAISEYFSEDEPGPPPSNMVCCLVWFSFLNFLFSYFVGFIYFFFFEQTHLDCIR